MVDFRLLARQLMFELSDEEVAELTIEFATLQKQLALLDEVDSEELTPLVFPFEGQTSYLRADEVNDCLTVEEVLLNAKEKTDDMIVLPKVVG